MTDSVLGVFERISVIKILQTNFITEEDGNMMWSEMIKRKRKLPYESFSELLRATE